MDVDLQTDNFEATPSNIMYLSSVIPHSTFPLQSIADYSFISIMPIDTYCWDKSIRIDCRPANIKIYGIDGVKNAAYYHGVCSKCKYKVYYNYFDW